MKRAHLGFFSCVVLAAVGIFVGWTLPSPRHATPPPVAEPPAEVSRDQLRLVDGRWWRAGDAAPFTGVMVERYPEGALRTRSEILEGKLDGVCEGWTPEGALEVRESFRAGVSHGLRTRWYAHGVRRSEATVVDGRMDGVFVSYHPDGSLAESVPMKEGLPHGVSRAYHPDGRLKAEVELDRGQVVAPTASALPSRPLGTATDAGTSS